MNNVHSKLIDKCRTNAFFVYPVTHIEHYITET